MPRDGDCNSSGPNPSTGSRVPKNTQSNRSAEHGLPTRVTVALGLGGQEWFVVEEEKQTINNKTNKQNPNGPLSRVQTIFLRW